ncbi:sensor histidine kinase [Streptomyces sp. CMB-StM0423]|uniref:sensor histidine kinase n=1 Tax=Streptomyces sp. CMB-StM0423 TaxID=2059884 RepID=UPI000C6FFC26|nr:HAMP domain-containing sensor histidine kinase [Streptomyces sp. CMB-StM0423]AUH42333.1 two-component sensor histidine kinase [Streptomyces sp. CMB-StM0423]
MTSRFGRLPLRSRLALLTAAAMAVAIAAAAVSCWLITRDQLMSQFDRSLRQAEVPSTLPDIFRTVGCVDERPPGPPDELNTDRTTAQIVLADGSACWLQGEHTITVTETDQAIAAGGGPQRTEVVHDVTSDGTEWRVRTISGGLTVNRQPAAISIARPLSEVTDPLNTLALVLALVAGGGVLGAGAIGLGVARAGLRPVERLTHTVEHIARTEDLAVEIPVEGDDEIARLSRSFNAMTAALATSQERQQQLIADAGHELRTPLTSLRTNIELLARSEESGRELPPRQRRELLESVTAQMTELAALIGDLQELSRPDAAPDKAQLEVVALDEIAERAVRRVRLRAPEVRIDAELAPWFVRAEPAALERAVVNLLDNAVKFSPAGSRVEVGLGGDGLLRVRDHGPGIPEAELPHVFERFWRSPSARSRPGSGLGLSIVARTVQQAGGTVALRRAAGGGTEALLRLPGAPEPPPGSSAAIRGRGPDRSA